MSKTISEFFSSVEKRVNARATAGMNAILQFLITGENGGQWNVAVKDGTVSVNSGVVDAPNITITAGDNDWLALVSGRMSPQVAFVTGRVRLQGDVSLAIKLHSLLQFA